MVPTCAIPIVNVMSTRPNLHKAPRSGGRLFRYGVCGVLPLALIIAFQYLSHRDESSWAFELLAYLIPGLLLLGLLILLALLLARPKLGWWLLPLCALLWGMQSLRETFRIELRGSDEDHDLTVMSFNAALFNPQRPSTKESRQELYADLYDHFRSHTPPDVLCIQEFFHSARTELELTADSLRSLGGYTYFHTHPVYDAKYKGLVGNITFSRLPVVRTGKVDLGDRHAPSGSWVDVVAGTDTVRVFNTQFRSMSIRWRTWDAGDPLNNALLNVRDITHRLKWGYRVREKQLDRLEQQLAASPHPVILCADLNALPYSRTYQRLKKRYRNAFEQRGSGLGATYHHFPWFVRIDHQFVDRRATVTYFRTRTEISLSDHYPIEAGYRVRR